MEKKLVVLVIHVPFKPDTFPLPGHTCKPHLGFHKEKAGVHYLVVTHSVFLSLQTPPPPPQQVTIAVFSIQYQGRMSAAHTSI